MLPGADLVDATDTLQNARTIKGAEEIAAMEDAEVLCAGAFNHLIEIAGAGNLDQVIERAGAQHLCVLHRRDLLRALDRPRVLERVRRVDEIRARQHFLQALLARLRAPT